MFSIDMYLSLFLLYLVKFKYRYINRENDGCFSKRFLYPQRRFELDTSEHEPRILVCYTIKEAYWKLTGYRYRYRKVGCICPSKNSIMPVS